jgi:hypothetical protein
MLGTTANPVLSTAVAIQTSNIRKRDINSPPALRFWYWMRLHINRQFFINTEFFFDLETLSILKPICRNNGDIFNPARHQDDKALAVC